MKNIASATIALAVCVSGPAIAADMTGPVYKAAPALSAVPTWTGFYVGVNGGYAWHDRTVTFSPNDPPSLSGITQGGGTLPPPASFAISGGLGGFQFGYNWQFNQNWLLGFETDFDWSRIRGTGQSNFSLVGAASNFQTDQNVDWFGTVRGRLGWMPTNKWLVYGTGGFAYGRVNENVTNNTPGITFLRVVNGFSLNCFSALPNCFVGNSSRTATGWTAGVGSEYMLWNNVSLKAEYLYVNLGSGDTVNTVQVRAATNPASFTSSYSHLDVHLVRAGINYRF